MSLTHCAQGQDNPLGTTGEPRLIGMRDHAGVHQRSRRIAVFMAEIGADQLLLLVPDVPDIDAYLPLYFFVALPEDVAGLPMAGLEIAIYQRQFRPCGAHVHGPHRVARSEEHTSELQSLMRI